VPVRAESSRGRPAGTDIDCLVADRTRAGAVLGWTPRVRLEEGMCRTMAWMEAQA
jgi:nucleoside-diphosphate-sugar epimerase